MEREREHMLEQFENALSGDHAQNVVQFSADTTQQRTSSALDLVHRVKIDPRWEHASGGRVSEKVIDRLAHSVPVRSAEQPRGGWKPLQWTRPRGALSINVRERQSDPTGKSRRPTGASDVAALSLPAQVLVLTETWYWELNEASRAWSKRWNDQ